MAVVNTMDVSPVPIFILLTRSYRGKGPIGLSLFLKVGPVRLILVAVPRMGVIIFVPPDLLVILVVSAAILLLSVALCVYCAWNNQSRAQSQKFKKSIDRAMSPAKLRCKRMAVAQTGDCRQL